MQQKNRFWIAFIIITLVCFADYQLFTEGYAVRQMKPIYRQAGHMIILLAVIPIGYWAWSKHTMQWTSKLWLLSYIAITVFILLTGVLKTIDVLNNRAFMEWVATVRYVFVSPLPHILLYMLTLIAKVSKQE